MRKRLFLASLLLVTLAVASYLALSGGPRAAVAQETGPELAVYNQGVALVKDTRTLTLDSGTQLITISDVAAQIDPTSVHFRSLTDPAGTIVLEQNFEYDLVGVDKLLSRYVDQQVQVITNDGTTYGGTLMSGSGDIILQDAEGRILVISRSQVRDFSFPSLPDGLITRPSLVWLLDATQAGQHEAEITYMTSGISWQANYVLLLAEDGQSLDLSGWVTLDNRSGATYTDAKLKLIAGDINRVQPEYKADYAVGEAMPTAAAAPMEERGFFEYHLYEVQRPVTVRDNQTKQIEMVTAADVAALKFYVYEGNPGYTFWGSPEPDPTYGASTGVTAVRTFIEFSTGEDGANAQLPAGVVRVYQNDVDGSALLVGEDSIGHTPKDETVQLYVGDAFDIVGERVQTDFRQIGTDIVEESYEITLRNHKEEDVQVRVMERLFRWSDWDVIEESAPHTKLDSETVEWRLDVPAGGEATVTYTVRYKW